MDWTAFERSLSAEDTEAISQSLGQLKLSSKDKNPVNQSLLQECVSKLSSEEPVIRSGAIQVLNHAVQTEASPIKFVLSDLCKGLANPNVLSVKSGKDSSDAYVDMHTSLCSMIAILQARYPDRLMANFKPMAAYLSIALGHENREIATAACEYWATLMAPPVPPALMEAWVAGVLPRLGKLIPGLLKALMYHPEHIKYIQQNTQDTGGRETPVSMENYTNLRNYAALSLETICGMFQKEAIMVMKPLIPRWLGSSNWLEKEAMILALGALTTAVGTHRDLRDIYPAIFKQLLAGYSHQQALIRSITCFTMQQFINADPAMLGIKDPFTKMFKCTLHLLADYNCEVQEMAIQSLSALLAFAEKDITPYSRKLIDELIKAESMLQGRARQHYYECVGHIVGRLGPGLEERELTRLLDPCMQEWRNHSHHSNDTLREATLMLCQALCVVAVYAKDSFSPYNTDIFNKVTPYFEQGGSNGHGDISSNAVTAYLVAYLDLLSALIEGQGQSAANQVVEHCILPKLISMLGDKRYTPAVHQSTLALLGHMCNTTYTQVHSWLDGIIKALAPYLDTDQLGQKNNAIWTLACITSHSPDCHPKFTKAIDSLTKLILNPATDESFQIYASLALTNMCRRWPSDVPSMSDDVFMAVCLVLQHQFPRDQEKITIFTNVCHIMAADLKAVSMEIWVQFCIAAALLDSPDTGLQRRLKAILKEGRASMGSYWSKVMQQTGSQVAYTLRKRYKMYWVTVKSLI